MPAKHQKIDLRIPKSLTRRERIELADLVIEHIVDRTQRGKDKDGRAFPRYSKEYTKSLDFNNAGKSAGDVNLTLSGDMLAALQILDDAPGKIRIGFERGSDENARADGNIRGTYGSDTPSRKKARDFLGIKPEVLSKLIDRVKKDGE